MAHATKGVTAADIKAMFYGLSVSVSKVRAGLWKVVVSKQPGAYLAYRNADWVSRSYPGEAVQLEMPQY